MSTTRTRQTRIANALKALRPHARDKLVVVFGAGGDRDPGKRPLMGAGGGGQRRPPDRHRRQSAQRRSRLDPQGGARRRTRRRGDRRPPRRDPAAASRAEGRRHPADRRQGPRDRSDGRRQGAAVLRSGRGAPGAEEHQGRQRELSLDDRGFRRSRRAAGCRASRPPAITGVSIDSRTIEPGEAFVAIRGERRDGHDFVAAGAEGRRGTGDRRDEGRGIAGGRPAARRAATIRSQRWSGSARRRARACAVRSSRVTGSVGKTGTKEMLRLALVGDRRDACAGRLVQQPVGRAADARPHAGGDALRRLRDRHEPCRRDPPAGEARAPARGDRHDGRAGAPRLFRQRGGDRRGQGGDFRGAGAGRHGRPQPRQSLVRPARRTRARARRAHRFLRRARRPPTCGWSASTCMRTGRACRLPSAASPRPTGSARRAAISCRTRSPCSPPPHALGADLAARHAGARPVPRAEGKRRADRRSRTRRARSR